MRRLFMLVSFVFHPVFIPIMGTLVYYFASPRYILPESQKNIIFSVLILTVAIPCLAWFFFRNLGWVSAFDHATVHERKLPILVNLFLTGIIIYRIIPPTISVELYYFFVGIMGTLIAAFILTIFKVKASLHLMGVSGLLMFLVTLGIHFRLDFTLFLGILVAVIGLLASARLYFRVHNVPELWIGFFIGLIPQLITIKYWL